MSNFFLKFVATDKDLIILEMINITVLIDCSFYLIHFIKSSNDGIYKGIFEKFRNIIV